MNKKTRFLSTGLLLTTFTASFPLGIVLAAEPAASDDSLQELLQVLEQETAIATKNRLNIDFVPGMVSVLYGDDLLVLGVRTASEAMALVPGVELGLSSDGQTQVFVRGIGTAFASGKVKVLLNGVPFNSTLSVATTALRIPVEQIERIEVIRGSGSAIYGEFAFSGVINVITRQDRNQAFVRYSQLDERSAGASLSRHFEEQDMSMSLNFFGTAIRGDQVKTGEDILQGSAASNAPGTSNEAERDSAIIFQTRYKDFSLSTQWVRVESGDYFGIAHALPSYSPRLIRNATMLSVNAEQHWSLNQDLNIDARVGWLDYELASGLHEFYPADYLGPGTPPVPVMGSPNYKERKYRAGLDVGYSGWERHAVLAGIEWLYTDQGDTYAVRNYAPFTPTPVLYRGAGNWLEEGLSREVFGVFVQDQYVINEHFTLTAGIRLDAYDDVGKVSSPRLAALYHVNDKQLFKVQYARAFRPPTFLETATKNNPVVSGNPDIESERIENIELGYIYNDHLKRFALTLFYADLHDLILIDYDAPSSPTYVNEGIVHSYGAEIEYSQKIGREFKLAANAAYVHPRNETDNSTVADVADVTGNLSLIYQPVHDYSTSLRYRYVGKRHREETDTRSALEGFDIVDVTASVMDVAETGFDIYVGVKNVFDQPVVYPAPLVRFNGASIPAYEEDYPRPGREVWLETAYRF